MAALDIEMTEDDFESMDNGMLVSQWNKMRQSLKDTSIEREQLRDNLGQRNVEINTLNLRLTHALSREAAQQRTLAAFASKLVDIGVLDALSLNKVEDDQ